MNMQGVKTRKTKMQRITSVPANIVSMPLPSHLSGIVCFYFLSAPTQSFSLLFLHFFVLFSKLIIGCLGFSPTSHLPE